MSEYHRALSPGGKVIKEGDLLYTGPSNDSDFDVIRDPSSLIVIEGDVAEGSRKLHVTEVDTGRSGIYYAPIKW
jgi:hypothetical protein